MAAYPAHNGLAGASGVQSVRAGDDWARSARIDATRLASVPLASTTRVERQAGDARSTTTPMVSWRQMRTLQCLANRSRAANVVDDDHRRIPAANDYPKARRATAGPPATTAFIDESESYLSKGRTTTTNAAATSKP